MVRSSRFADANAHSDDANKLKVLDKEARHSQQILAYCSITKDQMPQLLRAKVPSERLDAAGVDDEWNLGARMFWIAAGFASMVALTAPTISRAQSLYLDGPGVGFGVDGPYYHDWHYRDYGRGYHRHRSYWRYHRYHRWDYD